MEIDAKQRVVKRTHAVMKKFAEEANRSTMSTGSGRIPKYCKHQSHSEIKQFNQEKTK
jgi:hypothetical protein